MVSPDKLASSERARNSFTFKNSSARKTFFSSFSERLKILESLMLGNNFEIRSASFNAKSRTRAVSRIEDFAAIVP